MLVRRGWSFRYFFIIVFFHYYGEGVLHNPICKTIFFFYNIIFLQLTSSIFHNKSRCISHIENKSSDPFKHFFNQCADDLLSTMKFSSQNALLCFFCRLWWAAYETRKILCSALEYSLLSCYSYSTFVIALFKLFCEVFVKSFPFWFEIVSIHSIVIVLLSVIDFLYFVKYQNRGMYFKNMLHFRISSHRLFPCLLKNECILKAHDKRLDTKINRNDEEYSVNDSLDKTFF